MSLTAAVLAAGRSQRMGRPKLLLPLGGAPLIRHVVDALARLAPSRLLVIVRAEGEGDVRSALEGSVAEIVTNAEADHGMGTSIACAARSLSAKTTRLIIAQGDQPLVSTEAFASVAEALTPGLSWAAARYGELVTTPVAFAQPLFGELRELVGDRGARSVLEAHRPQGAVVDLPEWMGLDVDDEDGYRRVRELWAPGSD